MKKLLIFDFSDTLVDSKSGKILVSKKQLSELKRNGYMLAMFTAGKRAEVNSYVTNRYMKIFDFTVSLEDVKETKPSPEGVNLIIKKLKPEKTIYVGDSENDFRSALAANVSFLTPDLIYLL